MKANLHLLDEPDQRLVRVLATMGVRRSEAFQIASEETENRIWYRVVGADKGMARRRLPFPADLLSDLPKGGVKGPLLKGRPDNAGKRIRAWLTDIGVINDKDGRDIAPMHSFRHRAAQRMPRHPGGCARSNRRMGQRQGQKDFARYGNKHGAGYPISVLRKAIDRIGFERFVVRGLPASAINPFDVKGRSPTLIQSSADYAGPKLRIRRRRPARNFVDRPHERIASDAKGASLAIDCVLAIIQGVGAFLALWHVGQPGCNAGV